MFPGIRVLPTNTGQIQQNVKEEQTDEKTDNWEGVLMCQLAHIGWHKDGQVKQLIPFLL